MFIFIYFILIYEKRVIGEKLILLIGIFFVFLVLGKRDLVWLGKCGFLVR